MGPEKVSQIGDRFSSFVKQRRKHQKRGGGWIRDPSKRSTGRKSSTDPHYKRECLIFVLALGIQSKKAPSIDIFGTQHLVVEG